MDKDYFAPTFITASNSFEPGGVELLLKSGRPAKVYAYLKSVFTKLMNEDLGRAPICFQSLESLLAQYAVCQRELALTDGIREQISWLKRTHIWPNLALFVRAKLLRFVDRKKEALDEFAGVNPEQMDHATQLEYAWGLFEVGRYQESSHNISKYLDSEALLLQALIAEASNSMPEAYRIIVLSKQTANRERDWHLFIHCLLVKARILRKLGKREKVAQVLAQVREAISSTPEWIRITLDFEGEMESLKNKSADLVIDRKRRVLRTREMLSIPIGKQFILVEILEYLAQHSDRTISKKELIEKVWQERYIGKPHDNRVYSNLNRLRKLIEPRFDEPTYILASIDGYRFAPKLKVVVKR